MDTAPAVTPKPAEERIAPLRFFVQARHHLVSTHEFTLFEVSTLHAVYRDRRLAGLPLEYVDEMEYAVVRQGPDLALRFHCEQRDHALVLHCIYADVTLWGSR